MKIIDFFFESYSRSFEVWPIKTSEGSVWTKWIRLAGVVLGESRGRNQSSGGFNKPTLWTRKKMEDRDTFFYPLSPSCFKQISCFQGLSYAVQNPQHDMETFDKGKKSWEVGFLVLSFLYWQEGFGDVWSGHCWGELQKASVMCHTVVSMSLLRCGF